MTSPLRPELYRRLDARFGPVKIANEGEEMIWRPVRDEDGRLKLQVDWPGEYYKVSCMFCNDGRGRLWINHRWGLYIPELKTGNLWLAHCYNEGCLQYCNRARQLYDRLFSDVVNGRFRDPVLPGQRRPPEAYAARPAGPYVYPLHGLAGAHPAIAYLRSRGYDTDWLGRELGVGYCLIADPDFPLANDRIIIPVMQHGRFMGWQARSIDEPYGDQPKYWTMKGMAKTKLLYNLDLASRSPFVVICEGPTDVWSFGPEAVALFGKSISAEQVRLVTSTWQTAVVLLDGDAFADAVEVYDSLRAVSNRAIVTLPAGTDPGDYERAPLREFVVGEALKQGVDLGMAVSTP